MKKKIAFALESLGCAKNQVDSELMITCLEDVGLGFVESAADSDLIIVNTCGFISPAKEEAVETLFQFRERYPDKMLIAAGCLCQRYGDILEKKMPEIDGFLYSQRPEDIVRVVQDVLGEKAVPEWSPPRDGDRPRRRKILSHPGSVYLKISEGCSNGCSYCAIPLIKGSLNSRRIGEILKEVRQLVSRGIFEINLVAQDLGSFGRDRGDAELPTLLKEILGLKEQFWIRLLYIHPDHFPKAVLELMKQDDRLLPYFDLPIQHASRRILREMGRKGDAETYLDLLNDIRSTLPAAVLRTTFLVGFPGENENDFEELLSFQERGRFDWVGVFAFSPEEGTAAASLSGRVKQTKAGRRKEKLERNQVPITEERLDRFLGSELTVLVEEAISGDYIARGYMNAPEVDGLVLIRSEGLSGKPGEILKPGDNVATEIVKRNGFDLEAVVLPEAREGDTAALNPS